MVLNFSSSRGSGGTNTARGMTRSPLASSCSRRVKSPPVSSSSVLTTKHLSSSLGYYSQLQAPPGGRIAACSEQQLTDQTVFAADNSQSHQIQQKAEGCFQAGSGRGHLQAGFLSRSRGIWLEPEPEPSLRLRLHLDYLFNNSRKLHGT